MLSKCLDAGFQFLGRIVTLNNIFNVLSYFRILRLVLQFAMRVHIVLKLYPYIAY